jgi:hypothetical protein
MVFLMKEFLEQQKTIVVLFVEKNTNALMLEKNVHLVVKLLLNQNLFVDEEWVILNLQHQSLIFDFQKSIIL